MNPPLLIPQSGVSEDLREVFGADALLHLTLEVTQGLAVLPKVSTLERPNPRMLLTLLTFAYAGGLFSSEDVERSSFHDSTLRYICARETISAMEVRRFRRENRPWIEHCLTQVIARVWLQASRRPEFRDATGAAEHAIILDEALRTARRRVSLALQMDAADRE